MAGALSLYVADNTLKVLRARSKGDSAQAAELTTATAIHALMRPPIRLETVRS